MMRTQELETPQKRRKLDQNSSMEQQVHVLPSDIMNNILLRIPAEFLVSFKAVCKPWCKLISDPEFVHAHLTRHQGDVDQILVLRLKVREYELINLQEIQAPIKFQLCHHQLQNFLKDEICISSSCDGLLLFQSKTNEKKLHLCNPVTRICTTLPPLETDHVGSMWQWKLVSDSSVKKYKAVGLTADSHRWFLYTPHTYSNSNRENLDQTTAAAPWKEFVTSNQTREYISNSIFLDNKIHWLVSPLFRNEVIMYTINLSTEQFTETPLSFLTKGDGCKNSMIQVTGHISITDYCHAQNQLDVWILHNDMKKSLWTKDYTVACEFNLCEHIYLHSHPSSTSSNETRFLAHYENQIYVCDLKTKRWKKIDFPVPDNRIIHGSLIHTNSLVRWN